MARKKQLFRRSDSPQTLLSRNVKDNVEYYLLMLIPLLLILVFSYLPMFGLVISFQDYSTGRPFLGEGVKWVGFKWFEKFMSSFYFPRILRNTVVLNLMNLFMGFW
ncbi:MAG: sugar ABC transporter permease, partial [Clostridiales bacterium]|nr:sugar ABC transporter permease [Clostridiales bacterium]